MHPPSRISGQTLGQPHASIFQSQSVIYICYHRDGKGVKEIVCRCKCNGRIYKRPAGAGAALPHTGSQKALWMQTAKPQIASDCTKIWTKFETCAALKTTQGQRAQAKSRRKSPPQAAAAGQCALSAVAATSRRLAASQLLSRLVLQAAQQHCRPPSGKQSSAATLIVHHPAPEAAVGQLGGPRSPPRSAPCTTAALAAASRSAPWAAARAGQRSSRSSRSSSRSALEAAAPEGHVHLVGDDGAAHVLHGQAACAAGRRRGWKVRRARPSQPETHYYSILIFRERQAGGRRPCCVKAYRAMACLAVRHETCPV